MCGRDTNVPGGRLQEAAMGVSGPRGEIAFPHDPENDNENPIREANNNHARTINTFSVVSDKRLVIDFV